MSRFWIRLGATFFFTGHFPVAPATFASLVTLLLWWFLPPLPTIGLLAVIVAVAAVGVPLASRAEEFYGHDGKPIVIDEVAGVLLTVVGLGHSLPLFIAGFLLFRVLDVVKPPPAYQLQSLPRGWGIVADDLMAGLYGNLLLRVAAHFWPALLGAAPPA
jgi:phosphatidylglycerophosphatase A